LPSRGLNPFKRALFYSIRPPPRRSKIKPVATQKPTKNIIWRIFKFYETERFFDEFSSGNRHHDAFIE
jgi:hypothetical protein